MYRTPLILPVPERKLPWIMDIFLYPTSMNGVCYLVVFPIVISPFLFISLSPYPWKVRALMLYLLCYVVVYLLFYLADCVRDSAMGKIRAPGNLPQSVPIIRDRWDYLGLDD